jgi:hypothetical protein
LLDGQWVPTFQKAKYVFSRELNICDPSNNAHLPDEARDVFGDSVLPAIATEHGHVESMTDQLSDTLLIQRTPGRSPGPIMRA